jgi:hypothetical protein
MRWYVSIGVVLVAGVLAGGDVAGFAAPNPANRPGQQPNAASRQLADKEANPTVDVELVLAVDVSYSMDMDELALQREGYAQAIVSKEFLQALKSGPNGRISVTYFEWAASTDQKIIIPWRVIDGPETADAVANEILKTPIRRASRTSISGAINFAMPLFDENPHRGLRRVIDISGDGPNNNGAPVVIARDAAVEKGIVINGLPIMVKEPSYSTMDIDNLDLYYEDCVIGGPGSFVVTIKDRDKFKEAIRTKLLLEIAGRTPERPVVPAAGREARVNCMIGERSGRTGGEGEAAWLSSYPPLEGEGRRVAAGWGDGLSTSNSTRVERPSPPPRRAFRCAPCEPTRPLQGRVKTVRLSPEPRHQFHMRRVAELVDPA